MLQEHRLYGLEKSRNDRIVPPSIAVAHKHVTAADQNMMEGCLAFFVSGAAKFAHRISHVTADVTKVGSHHRIEWR